MTPASEPVWGVGAHLGDLVVRFRNVLVPGWIAAAALSVVFLPLPGEAGGGALGSLVPSSSPAVVAQQRSAELFAFPVLSNTAIVQRDPEGLTPGAQTRALARARLIYRRQYPDLLSVPFALPVLNTLGALPGASERGTTAVTFFYFEPGVSLLDRVKLAGWFEDRRFGEGDALVGATGIVPARVEEGRLITDALPLVELATVLLIGLVIGVTFRSVVAPLATLITVAVSYGVALGVVGVVGEAMGIGVPGEVEPILLVLLLGLVTDYCIFFLSGVRNRLHEGDDRLSAAQRTSADYTPIIGTAGLIVAAGAASLVVARLEFFRVFGPALGLTVLVGLVVSLTFVPAWLALLGRWAFWPGRPVARPGPPPEPRGVVALLSRSRRASLAVVAGTAVVLAAAAAGLAGTDLALTPIRGLPDDSRPARAADEAAAGFAPGIVAPTLVLVEGDEIAERRGQLLALQRRLEARPGVAGTIGPSNLPPDLPRGVLRSRDGDAARFFLVLEDEPLSAAATDRLAALRDDLPALLETAGLPGAVVSIGGSTALAIETVDAITSDLLRISLAVLAVNLLLLVAFLRSLVAPFFLLAASALAVAAALGLTVLVFEGLLDQDTTYYVPFMAAVLLVSLGSDYNIFLAGRIWQEARSRPLSEAVAIAAPRASRAITVAALALALSFALLALVPIDSFRQLAFAMVVGVLLDAFVVRSYLVPALVLLVGPRSGWPGRFRAL